MALDDWRADIGTGNMAASKTRADAGSWSWRFDGTNDTERLLTNKESETVAPTEAKVESRVYLTSFTTPSIGVAFRVQDVDNFIILQTTVEPDGTNVNLILLEKIGGAFSRKDVTSGATLQDDAWTSVEFLLWEDPADTIHARMLQDGLQIGGTDLSYSGVDAALSGGGAVGLYTAPSVPNEISGTQTEAFWDETEVFEGP